MKKKTIRLLALVFAMLFMLCACEGSGSTETPAVTTSTETTPETSSPETSAPDTSAPDTSAPDTSAPDTSAPDTAAPDTSAPDTGAPETDAPTPETGKTLRIMSFNVQCGISGTRDQEVLEYLINSGADSIGTQETADIWINRFRRDKTFREMYEWIGDGRDSDGTTSKGERCAILFRKDKYDLVESGTNWL